VHSDAHYRVFRSESPWGNYAMMGETCETHFLDAVPEAMKKYHYFVQTVCNGRSSEASAMAEAESFPPLPAPETPQNLRCTSQDNNAVELCWNPARAAAAYVIYARVDQTGEFSIIDHTLDCVYLHENLQHDSCMEYRVQAYHDSAASELSAVCSSRGSHSPRKCGTQKRYPNLSWQGFK
jgi:fibronectin type 3 domain-containing protein